MEVQRNLLVVKRHADALLPKRADNGAAGYDLHALTSGYIPKFKRELISTGLSIRVPHGYYGRIAPRSGLSWKQGILVGGGVIDENYIGDVGIILFNLGDQEFEFKTGDRIAQLILEKIATPDVEEVQVLDETSRGEKGFGSTGVQSTETEKSGHVDKRLKLDVN